MRFRPNRWAVLLLATVGCGGGAQGTEPDDMSAAEHREAAAAEEQKAEAHSGRYDPSASSAPARGGAGTELAYSLDAYNPTQVHLGHAEVHSEHAEAHTAAAEALESFEEEQCAEFPTETRKLCPLLGKVTGTEDIDGGVRVTFADDANMDAVVAHMRCHFAFARTRGYEGMDQCPLYLEGVSVSRVEGEPAAEMTVDDPELVEELRARTASHVVE